MAMASVPIHVPDAVWKEGMRLNDSLRVLPIGNRTWHVYYPFDYASAVYQDYLGKYCYSEKPILFLGMNPGPNGMVQNGVPFGDFLFVREWMKLAGEIHKPQQEHPYRPILGWQNKRRERSGKRLWGLIQKICGAPEDFFKYCFVHNYCPLAFLASSGRNLAPDKLPAGIRKQLIKECDESLINISMLLNVEIIVCLGKFVTSRVQEVFGQEILSGRIEFVTLPHPSPQNIRVDEQWIEIARQNLIESETKVMKYLQWGNFV